MNNLSNIINKLESSHDKRKTVMNTYAKKNFIQLLEQGNAKIVVQKIMEEHQRGMVSTQTQTDVNMETPDLTLKNKTKLC